MYEEELKRILDASQKNALSFFVGAGVSALSNAPTWKGLINAICDRMGIEKKVSYSSDEFLQIPQMFYYSLDENKAEYHRFVKEQLNVPDLFPNAIHREMLNLNPVSFITTNYDTLLEDTAIQHCQSFKVVACDETVPTIFGDRFILKVHGDFTKNNFVLKEEDYLNYSESFKLIETLTKAIFSTNTVVFIGYSLNDYNIKLILNWAKSLLKNNFRKPIFVYTGDQPLTKEELIYHESKGLSVIEWQNMTAAANTNEYLPRYQVFFDALKKLSQVSLDGKTEDDAFEMLYSLLQPLNRLNSLRVEDVSKRLYPHVRIEESGLIRIPKNGNVLLKKFFTINQMSESQQNSVDVETLEKYYCIFNVFKKARILEVNDEHKFRCFIEDAPFADKNCILFDYTAMNIYAAKEYTTLEKKYRKAYYLSRLYRYNEAFYLFAEVAKQAFVAGDYLLYYMAEANCISLHKIITNANMWYGCYDILTIDAMALSDSEIENLFRSLPVEFRNTYDSLKDIHSANLLYKYSYEAFIDGLKLQNAIESGSAEFGLTSSDKAICRINDYLHFLQGNGIIADVFVEYKSTVKNLMSLLVYKYSTQSKEVIHEQLFPFSDRNKIYFDEIDFYCFIDCFSDKEIKTLFNKYHVETIEFHNMDRIETAVCNILVYYDNAVKTSKNKVDVIALQSQIKKCITLLRFINISQPLVDKICKFILTHEFREILISDKVFFLDAQLYHRKKYSEVTEKVVEDTLIAYIDKHISSLERGEKFDVLSASSGINYYCLVKYISSPERNYVSRRLSMRISHIIENKLTQMYPHITKHYAGYVSDYQKKRLITWANKQIAEYFSFDLVFMLVTFDARINAKAKALLKDYLRKSVESAKENNNNGIMVYPENTSFDELTQVGYWCRIGVLKTKDFMEFIGSCDAFDFYCEYTGFDFRKFDVSWLINLYPHTLMEIANNKTVKEKIRMALAAELKNKALVKSDMNRLQDILITYFC